MFCGHCGAPVHDSSHRFCPSCGRPLASTSKSASGQAAAQGTIAEPATGAVEALVDAAVAYERQAVETGNNQKYLPLAEREYKKALNGLDANTNPELYCTISFYLARLYYYAATEHFYGFEGMASMPDWGARYVLEQVLPVAKRIRHEHYAEYHEMYKRLLPGTLGD